MITSHFALFSFFNGMSGAHAPTPPTPTPTPPITVSGGASKRIFGPIDWSRLDKLKKKAKKKSKKAVEIVEAVVSAAESEGLGVTAALDALERELDAARIVHAAVFDDLLKVEIEMREADEDEDDDFLLLSL